MFTLSPKRPVRLAPLALALWSLVTPAFAAEAPLEQAMATVFTVHSADAEDRFLGSAFLWGEGGEVAVTNAHVVGAAGNVRLTDASGHQEIGVVIARDAARDVAVIGVVAGRRGLVAGPEVALGQEVWALGAPLGIEFTLTRGAISARARQVDATVPIRMLQHDAAVNPGSSGGPLVDDQGRLLGMNSQIADGSRMFVGIAYAISAADLGTIVPGLIEETLLPLPRLGLTARAVDRQVAKALNLSPGGLLVDAVAPASLAARGGIVAGDVILALDNIPVTQPGDLAFALERALPKGAVDVAILRDGKMILLPLPLLRPSGDPGLAMRDVDAGSARRVASYSLATLGIVLGEAGRISVVSENSAALFAGVAGGDRILAVNGAELTDPALTAISFCEPVLLRLLGENGMTRHVVIDPWATGARPRPVGGANVLDPAVLVF